MAQWDSSLSVLPVARVQFPTMVMVEYYKGFFPGCDVLPCTQFREKCYLGAKWHPLGKAFRSWDAYESAWSMAKKIQTSTPGYQLLNFGKNKLTIWKMNYMMRQFYHVGIRNTHRVILVKEDNCMVIHVMCSWWPVCCITHGSNWGLVNTGMSS